MEFSLSEVAQATSGHLDGADVAIRGVSIDSRSVRPEELFVPVIAERDGHRFIADAVKNGAVAHLASKPWSHPSAGASVAWVGVGDTTVALQDLGRVARSRLRGNVIGVTGSVGKTTTKDLLAAALGESQTTHSSFRSFNNELGVPLTLVNAPADAEAVIVEMGARGVGHIAELCDMARPTIGVVLAVGAAHTELFGDLDAVAQAKGELLKALPSGGTAVLNAADPRVMGMAPRTEAEILTFGAGGEVCAHDIEVDDALRPRFRLTSPWGNEDILLASAGIHTVINALAATAAALAAGADLASIAHGLRVAEVSPWRMEVTRGIGGALVINDAYNANPMSMNAAIDALLAVSASRRLAIVGVMAELGEESRHEHLAIGARLADEGIEVIAVGVEEYGGTMVGDATGALAVLGSLGPDCAVLVKASRIAGLEDVAAELVD